MTVLAVDGGNTKTVAVVASDDGAIVGVALGGCTDLYGARSTDAALGELYRVVDAALASARTDPAELDAAALSLAGTDWEDDFELQAAEAAERLPGVPVEIVNDAVGPIRCAARDGAGVSLICGTGAAIGARGHDGRSWHIGFTPRHCGAHGLVKEALAAVQEADMECGPATELTGRLLATLGLSEPRELVHAVTHRGRLSDFEIAALAPQVLTAAVEGDGVARGIVDVAGQRMGCWTRHAAHRVALDRDYPLVLAGGLLRAAGSERLVEAALAELADARPTLLRAPPVLGAVLMAFDLAGVTVEEDVVADGLLRAGIDGMSPRTGGCAGADRSPGAADGAR